MSSDIPKLFSEQGGETMVKRNTEIRAAAKNAGVFLYEIAEKLDVSEPTFNRYLRKELPEGLKAKALAAIEEIKREHAAEPSAEN